MGLLWGVSETAHADWLITAPCTELATPNMLFSSRSLTVQENSDGQLGERSSGSWEVHNLAGHVLIARNSKQGWGQLLLSELGLEMIFPVGRRLCWAGHAPPLPSVIRYMHFSTSQAGKAALQEANCPTQGLSHSLEFYLAELTRTR